MAGMCKVICVNVQGFGKDAQEFENPLPLDIAALIAL
jgi:hypothetical protein